MPRLMYQKEKGISRVIDPDAEQRSLLQGWGKGLMTASLLLLGTHVTVHNIFKLDRQKQEKQVSIHHDGDIPLSKMDMLKKSIELPKDSLQLPDCLWGAVKGNQDLLMPEEYNSLTVKDGENEFIFVPGKPSPKGFIILDSGVDKPLRFKTSSRKSIELLELMFSTGIDYPLKAAGEEDGAHTDGFYFIKAREVYGSFDDCVKEVTLISRKKPSMIVDEKGNAKDGVAQISDTISICRIPLITGNPERAVYLHSFSPEKMVLEELLGRVLNVEMNVELSFLEAGSSETILMKQTNNSTTEINLNLDPKAYGLKDGEYCHVAIHVTVPTNVRLLDKKLGMFSRLLLVRDGKFIDPFDSVKNSAYEQAAHNNGVVSEPVLCPVKFQKIHGLSVGSAHYADIFNQRYLVQLVSAKNSQDVDITVSHCMSFQSRQQAILIRNGKPVISTFKVGSKEILLETGLASPVVEESPISVYFRLLNPKQLYEDSIRRIEGVLEKTRQQAGE
ncbi:hypothetical protein HY486_03130 [Candidatus Woesearchaeota archaeon]|nr:hypothetical protein [Candidatus Woesearchaeota archaeon]